MFCSNGVCVAQLPVLGRTTISIRALVSLDPSAPLPVPTKLKSDRLPPLPSHSTAAAAAAAASHPGAASTTSSTSSTAPSHLPGTSHDRRVCLTELSPAHSGGSGAGGEANKVFGDLLKRGAGLALVDVRVGVLELSLSMKQCEMVHQLITLPEVVEGAKSKPPPLSSAVPGDDDGNSRGDNDVALAQYGGGFDEVRPGDRVMMS